MAHDDFKDLAANAQALKQAADQWLTRASEINNAVPFVEQTKRLSENLQGIFAAGPSGYQPTQLSQIRTGLLATSGLLNSPLFQLPQSTLKIAVTFTGSASAVANHAALMLVDASNQADVQTKQWGVQSIPIISKWQSDEQNIVFIRSHLPKLHVGSETEFDKSVAEYRRCVSGSALPSAAGIALRNVLETLNGNLLQLARRLDPSAKVVKWPDAVPILVRGGPTGTQALQLLAQRTVFDDLHSKKLTPIAKNDLIPSLPDWQVIFGEYIGLLYTVLALIDFRDGS